MATVTSRRHKFKFYLSIILGALFLFGMGIAAILSFIKKYNQGIIGSREYLLPLVGAAMIFLTFYTIYRYYKNAPAIVLDGGFISFNSETFSLADIQEVSLTGKHNFPYIFSVPMEAATLHFNDGTSKLLFDDMYENSWELKSYLKQVVIDKKDFRIEQRYPVSKQELVDELYETFKGNHFISLRGILLWGFVGFFFYDILINVSSITTERVAIFGFVSIFWLILHAWLMHYFQISDKYFVVRNHIFFWKSRAVRLNDISEIVFETGGKMPNCLRIITKDFKTKLYPAGTLRDKTWLQLKDRLEADGIKVRNECI